LFPLPLRSTTDKSRSGVSPSCRSPISTANGFDRGEIQRVPCSNEMNRYLWTMYATVRQRFQETSKESAVRGFTSLPLSLDRSPFRHTGKSGERPHGAVSGVGDPKERHALLRVRPLGTKGVFGSRTWCGGDLPPLTLRIVARQPPGVRRPRAVCPPGAGDHAAGRFGFSGKRLATVWLRWRIR